MKFKRYLLTQREEEWKDNYIRYGQLKKLLVRILEEGAPVYVPTTLSLTVGNQPEGGSGTPQEQFFLFLEADVQRISDFTTQIASQLRARLRDVQVGLAGGLPGSPTAIASPQPRLPSQATTATATSANGGGGGGPPADLSDAATRERWLTAARKLGEEYLRLEKYVNLNYTGLQKILKKHDKLVPSAPCWQFYKVHINRQPWVRGDHQDIQVTLSRIFSQLHSAAAPAPAPGPPTDPLHPAPGATQHRDYTRNTFWIRLADTAQVKHVLMQHMAALPPPTNAPVAAHGASAAAGAAAMWAQCDSAARDQVNAMFLDNPSLELYHALLYGRPHASTLQLRWYGSRVPETVDIIRRVHVEGWRPEECSEDSFPIQETRVADFLNGRWTWADARKLMMPEEEPPPPPRAPSHSGHSSNSGHHHHHHHDYHSRHSSGYPTEAYVSRSSSTSSHRHHPNHPNHPTSQPQRSSHRAPDLPLLGSLPQGSFGSPPLGGLGRLGRGGGGSTVAEDPVRLAKEYQLFKTFTEVARLLESKGLQPMAQVRFRQTTFLAPGQEAGLRVVMEEEMQMLLEYAYDTTTRLSHGLWRQKHPADAIEFPYAVLKVHRPYQCEDDPMWLSSLVESGLLRPMPDFSKFLHACAGLLPDLVRAVPAWVDDEAVQKSLYANVAANEDLQALLLAGHNVLAELEEGVLGAPGAKGNPSGAVGAAAAPPPPTAQQQGQQGQGQGQLAVGKWRGHHPPAVAAAAAAAGLSAPANADKAVSRSSRSMTTGQDGASGGGAGAAAGGGVGAFFSRAFSSRRGGGGDGLEGVGGAGGGEGESPLVPLLHSLQRRSSSRLGGGQAAGWQAKLLQRQAAQGRAYQPQLIFLDPTQFLRNERIFLSWLRTAITVGGIATGMLGFTASAHTDPFERPTVHISALTAFVLLAVAIAMAGYGMASFFWRSTRFYELHPRRFDDTMGALAMTALVSMAMFALLVANMADLMEVLGDDDPADSGTGTEGVVGGSGWRGVAAAAEGLGGGGGGARGEGGEWRLGRGAGSGWQAA